MYNAIRYGGTTRLTAAIINGLLVDLKLATSTNKEYCVDKNSVRRMKKKLSLKYPKLKTTNSLYFDGKINNVLTNGKLEKQSNIILVSEPNTEFISHVKPNGRSTAENVTNAIIESFKDVNSSNLNVLGCDGTAGNTGNKGGILARMERHLNHKCHWVVSIYY